MLLHATIVLPRRVLDPVVQVVRSGGGAAPAGGSSPPKRFLGRRGRRASEPTTHASASPSATDEFRFLAPEAMSLPIAGFGNVTSSDAVRLADALQTGALDSPCATVQIAGGTALEFPEDRNVWARIEGDVDALMSMARGVTRVVERLGFYVDRRKFRPLLCVASVTDATTATRLEAVVAALDAFRGEPWTVDHVWLMKASYGSDASAYEEIARFPLASG